MTRLVITCPHCGEPLDVLQAVAEADHLEYLELLAGFGPARGAVSAYLDLFRAAPGAALRMATRLRLVRQLRQLWDTEGFAFGRATHQISRAQITDALHSVLRSKEAGAGFSNHNYLKQVMISTLNQGEQEQRRQAGQAARAREESLRQGRRPAQGPEDALPQGEEKPLWEQPLEDQIVSLACCYKSPLLSGSGWKPRVEASLRQAGVDLEVLRTLAQRAEGANEFVGRGAELLRRCRQGEPTQAGECLPET